MRLIPGKTKVHIELFRGVMIGDIVICAVALVMLIFVLISNIPWKLGIAIGIVAIAALLLFRMDGQPNYIYFLHILRFFGYRRRFGRLYRDGMLLEAGEKRAMEAAVDALYGSALETDDSRREAKRKAKTDKLKAKEEALERRREDKLLKSKKTPEDVKQAILEKRAAAAEQSMVDSIRESVKAAKGDAPLTEAQRRARRKEEDRILKSKTATEEEKQEILNRRAEASKESMRRAAEARDAGTKRAPMNEIFGVTGIRDGYIE